MIVWLVAGAHAGAWTKEGGQVYAKAGGDLYEALRFVSPGEQSASEGAYFGHRYGVYAEAGVLPGRKGQLALSVPLVVGVHRAEIVDPLGSVDVRATTARMGDLQAAAQVALHKSLPLAAAVAVKVPMYENGGVGADEPIYMPLFPKPGDGQVDLTGWFYAGAAPLPNTFTEIGLGYVHRTEWFVGWDTPITFVDQATFVAKAGRSFGPVLPVVAVEGVFNLAESTYSRQTLTVSGSALLDVAKGLAIEPRFAAELWAKNASQGIGGGVGLSYRR